MDCNKDEASRAKEISERKLLGNDVTGAQKFALKAQNLYPGLEGMPQLIATIDVFVAAENRINGEIDWYGILGVNPQVNNDTVRKQYRKLALMLHPDKNKSLRANDAFKLVSEAWHVLSDNAKRAAYDQKRNSKVFQRCSAPAPAPSGSSAPAPTKPPVSKGFCNLTKSSVKAPQTASQTSRSSIPAASHKLKNNTFWTICHPCKMQYEYLRVYRNQNLLCPNCQEPFVAVETAPPSIIGTKTSITWNLS